MKFTTSMTLGLGVLLVCSAVRADTSVSGSSNQAVATKTAIDNSRIAVDKRTLDSQVDSRRSWVANSRTKLTRQYLMDQQYRNSDQQLNQQRGYSSGVAQGAGNQGAASGHSQQQGQGDVNVGSLVSETHGDSQSGGGPHWQYAPQSNALSIGGDSYAPISLSNINANGGSIHIGDVNKGNLYNSQIGNNQHGAQGGDTVNSQATSQQQEASSQTASQDSVRN